MARKRDQGYDDNDENDGEDNYYEEDEEDEDEIQQQAPSTSKKKGPKRKKRRKNNLIDMEAEEDDADDDEEDEELADAGFFNDDDDDPAAMDNERSRAMAQRLERQQAMQNDDPRALARYFDNRYEREDEDYETNAPDTQGIDQQSLLPTIRDPRIWVVRCTKPGYERKAIFSLLQKMFNLRKKGTDIGILSAIAPEHLRGRIYIEAFSVIQVQLAISGLELFPSSITSPPKPLSLEEMPEILKLGKRPEKQVNGNWVRIKRRDSIYRGDLAQVYNTTDTPNDNIVTVRVIPRLDLKGEKDFVTGKDDPHGEKVAGTRQGRPPQKLFDRQEVLRVTGTTDVRTERDRKSGDEYDVWNEEPYRFGLLYIRKVSVKSLVTGEDVQPTVEELETWIMAEKHMKLVCGKDSSISEEIVARGLELDISSVAGRKTTKLFKGDSVRVTHGEQKGLEGTIVSIDGDVVLVKIAEFPDPVRVNRGHLSKNFKIGEHVKVASGKRAGYAGAIVRVEGEFLTIFTDSTREEVKVLSSQVADSADINTDVGSRRSGASRSLMRYELFDLVQLLSDPNEKGVVIQVRNEALTLLTPQNTRRVVPIGAVKGKVRDSFVRALDVRGNPIAPNDTIHVTNGPLESRQGVVKHVAGSTVFFKARDEVVNCGLLAVPANACTASTAAARRLTSTMSGGNNSRNLPAAIPRGAGPSNGRGGGRAGGFSRDELMREEIKIKVGQYKGYTGKVVDVMDRMVKVELASKMKTITISRDKVKLARQGSSDNAANKSSISGGLRAPLEMNSSSRGRPGSQTPAHPDHNGYRSQTPRPDRFNLRAGGMTPARTSATPGRPLGTPRNMDTPRSDDFRGVGTTPRAGGFDMYRPPATPSRAPIEGNPYQNTIPQTPATPAPAMPQTPMPNPYNNPDPRTPSGMQEPATPAYGMEPLTPAPAEPPTPAPGLEPRTPGPAPALEPRTPGPALGMEPQTPGPALGAMEPGTPMVMEPRTPHTPAALPQTPFPPEEEGAEMGYRVLVDVEVLVKGENEYSGKVVDAAKDGSYVQVRMLTGDRRGQDVKVDIAEITPVQPRAEVSGRPELVKVLDGPYASQTGRLLSIRRADNGEDMEGLIKLLSGEDATLNMSFVAKCSEDDI